MQTAITRMRLRVPMDGTVALEREVRIEAREARDDENLNNLMRIAWQPEGTVMFPRFEGTLVAWGEDDPAQSFIELRGHYTPPLGAAGQVFDELIGFTDRAGDRARVSGRHQARDRSARARSRLDPRARGATP